MELEPAWPVLDSLQDYPHVHHLGNGDGLVVSSVGQAVEEAATATVSATEVAPQVTERIRIQKQSLVRLGQKLQWCCRSAVVGGPLERSRLPVVRWQI